MTLPLYQVDAFAERPFTGNPAAVCWLEEPRSEAWMQQLAIEMNLSETAYVTPRKDGDFDLRWFTPGAEVDLCGHATLASAHVMWETQRTQFDQIGFHTRSGVLTAHRHEDGIELDFPATPATEADAPEGLTEALGCEIEWFGSSRFDGLAVVESSQVLRRLTPDFKAIGRLPLRGVIVTAQAHEEGHDFESRFFAPAVAVDEDPVTGSAHCTLAPYWCDRLGRDELRGFQASARGGFVGVRIAADRVALKGRAVTIFSTTLTEDVTAID